jgi:SAM-dependent methyltransferase
MIAMDACDEIVAISSGLEQRIAIPDEVFDRLYPSGQRFRSASHWTQIDVAMRATELLAPSPGQLVLDVGAGVGKLCLVGALTTPASWFGIERDLGMVGAATRAARRLGVADRVHFMLGDAASLDWSPFDAFYLYNPFAEALFSTLGDQLMRQEAYAASVELVQARLAGARRGTRVVTYHGFGGDLPPAFELVVCESVREAELCLWICRA